MTRRVVGQLLLAPFKGALFVLALPIIGIVVVVYVIIMSISNWIQDIHETL